LLASGVPGIDLTAGISQQDFLGFGGGHAMLELRLPPVGRVPIEPLESVDDQPHEAKVPDRAYMINTYECRTDRWRDDLVLAADPAGAKAKG
jgi:hypothetical protein